MLQDTGLIFAGFDESQRRVQLKGPFGGFYHVDVDHVNGVGYGTVLGPCEASLAESGECGKAEDTEGGNGGESFSLQKAGLYFVLGRSSGSLFIQPLEYAAVVKTPDNLRQPDVHATGCLASGAAAGSTANGNQSSCDGASLHGSRLCSSVVSLWWTGRPMMGHGGTEEIDAAGTVEDHASSFAKRHFTVWKIDESHALKELKVVDCRSSTPSSAVPQAADAVGHDPTAHKATAEEAASATVAGSSTDAFAQWVVAFSRRIAHTSALDAQCCNVLQSETRGSPAPLGLLRSAVPLTHLRDFGSQQEEALWKQFGVQVGELYALKTWGGALVAFHCVLLGVPWVRKLVQQPRTTRSSATAESNITWENLRVMFDSPSDDRAAHLALSTQSYPLFGCFTGQSVRGLYGLCDLPISHAGPAGLKPTPCRASLALRPDQNPGATDLLAGNMVATVAEPSRAVLPHHARDDQRTPARGTFSSELVSSPMPALSASVPFFIKGSGIVCRGPFNVPLICEVGDRQLKQVFGVSHGEWLRSLPMTAYAPNAVDSPSGGTPLRKAEAATRRAMVVGSHQGNLVVLFDGDQKGTVLRNVTDSATLRALFVSETASSIPSPACQNDSTQSSHPHPSADSPTSLSLSPSASSGHGSLPPRPPYSCPASHSDTLLEPEPLGVTMQPCGSVLSPVQTEKDTHRPPETVPATKQTDRQLVSGGSPAKRVKFAIPSDRSSESCDTQDVPHETFGGGQVVELGTPRCRSKESSMQRDSEPTSDLPLEGKPSTACSDPCGGLGTPTSNAEDVFQCWTRFGKLAMSVSEPLLRERFGVVHGQLLQYVKGIDQGKQVVVVGERMGNLWVTERVDVDSLAVQGSPVATKPYCYSIPHVFCSDTLERIAGLVPVTPACDSPTGPEAERSNFPALTAAAGRSSLSRVSDALPQREGCGVVVDISHLSSISTTPPMTPGLEHTTPLRSTETTRAESIEADLPPASDPVCEIPAPQPPESARRCKDDGGVNRVSPATDSGHESSTQEGRDSSLSPHHSSGRPTPDDPSNRWVGADAESDGGDEDANSEFSAKTGSERCAEGSNRGAECLESDGNVEVAEDADGWSNMSSLSSHATSKKSDPPSPCVPTTTEPPELVRIHRDPAPVEDVSDSGNSSTLQSGSQSLASGTNSSDGSVAAADSGASSPVPVVEREETPLGELHDITAALADPVERGNSGLLAEDSLVTPSRPGEMEPRVACHAVAEAFAGDACCEGHGAEVVVTREPSPSLGHVEQGCDVVAVELIVTRANSTGGTNCSASEGEREWPRVATEEHEQEQEQSSDTFECSVNKMCETALTSKAAASIVLDASSEGFPRPQLPPLTVFLKAVALCRLGYVSPASGESAPLDVDASIACISYYTIRPRERIDEAKKLLTEETRQLWEDREGCGGDWADAVPFGSATEVQLARFLLQQRLLTC